MDIEENLESVAEVDRGDMKRIGHLEILESLLHFRQMEVAHPKSDSSTPPIPSSSPLKRYINQKCDDYINNVNSTKAGFAGRVYLKPVSRRSRIPKSNAVNETLQPCFPTSFTSPSTILDEIEDWSIEISELAQFGIYPRSFPSI